MRVLLDECLPRNLRTHLPGHAVRTVRDMGWNGLRNGSLLGVARDRFDVLLTADRGLPTENAVARSGMAVVVLHAAGNRLEELLRLVPALLEFLPRARPGDVLHVGR